MALVRRETLYGGVSVLSVLVAAAGFVLVVSGNAEPYVSPDMVPKPRVAYWAAAAVAIAVPGIATGRLLKRRAWARMGRRAGLAGGGGLFGYPDLTGTHRGREVRVRTETRRKSSGGESGSTKITVTVVEAMLGWEAERGVVLAHTDRRRSRTSPRIDVEKEGSVSVANLAGMGPSPEIAEAVATPAVQAAVEDCENHGRIMAGDVAGEIRRQSEAHREKHDMDGLGGKFAGWVANKAAEGLHDRPNSVTTELQYLVLDRATLERQLDVVVAVADAFEDAMGDASGAAQAPE